MKVLTGEQLKTAEIMLAAFFPQSLLVYGCIFLINRRKSDPIDVFVDNWPEFTTIVCKPQRKEEVDFFKAIHIYSKDEPSLLKILGQADILPWQECFCIAIGLSHEDTVARVARDRGVSSKKVAVALQMMLQDVSRLPVMDSSLPLRLSSLDESHVNLVNRTWKFASEAHSARMIRNMICDFPSCCLLDKEGTPVSWILTYPYCALGMLYTVPEHRGRGYAKILISTMARRFHAEGYPVYCMVEEENHVSYNLLKELGFTEEPSYRWIWLRFNEV